MNVQSDDVHDSVNVTYAEVSGEQFQADVSQTVILEYLEIVKSEYEIERNKKQSFENRAGLVLALLGAICIFLFEHVKIKDIVSLMTISLSFVDLVKIIVGLIIYIAFLYTMIMSLTTIWVKQHNNFEVKNINETLLSENRLIALCKIIFTYRDIIIQHRGLNEKRAKTFRRSLVGVCITFIASIIYVTII